MFTKQVYKHSSTFPAHARMKYQCLHVQEAVGAGCRVQGAGYTRGGNDPAQEFCGN